MLTNNFLRKTSVAATAAVWLGASAGCAFNYAKKVEIAQLTTQRNAIQALKTQLGDQQYGSDKQDMELLVGADVLNAVLKVSDNLMMPIPGYRDGQVVINSVRYGAYDGSGLLDIDASAIDNKHQLNIRALINARITVVSDQKFLHGKVVVEQIAPVLSGRCWSIGLLRFSQALVNAKAADWSMNNLAFEFPLSQTVAVHIPAHATPNMSVGVPAGTLIGTLTLPGFDYEDPLKVNAIWLLHDGIHVLVSRGV